MPMSPRLLRPRAPGGFNPTRLSGLTQWYDAADTSTMTLNGTTVSEWRSKVGGVAVSQATASAQPTLTNGYYSGRSALTFDGGDFLSNATLPIQINGMTVAVVLDETTRVAFAGLVSGIPSSGSDQSTQGGFRFSVHEGTNRTIELLAGVSGGSIEAFPPVASEASALGKRIGIVTVAPSASGVGSAITRVGGVAGVEDSSYVAPSPASSTGTLIGGRYQSGSVSASFRFNGRILEIAIWNRALTVAECRVFEQYAAAKWGVTVA